MEIVIKMELPTANEGHTTATWNEVEHEHDNTQFPN
jgi:hypothetical protein